MLLFIEGYPYKLNYKVRDDITVSDALSGVVTFSNLEEETRFNYVGYCYSKRAKDVVFFLPKVVLTGETDGNGKEETVFGASPYDIIDFDSKELKNKFLEMDNGEAVKENYKEFLATLSIWIYRVLSLYKEKYNDNILESKENKADDSGNKKKRTSNTLLDIIIAMLDFNKENQHFFTFITRNLHSGFNKINWTKTIARKDAFMQDEQPIYLNPINKKRVVNFDEELLIIFFSILNYIKEEHGFTYLLSVNYPLINPDVIKNRYIAKNYGCRRLKQIKYKYFSDKALRIWQLCYAFFDKEHNIALQHYDKEYLLSRDFDHVFEVMIDELISDKKSLPAALSDQKDGKLVDHLFIGKGLIEAEGHSAEKTYYIGDSKYYKRTKNDRTNIGENSTYKQYTYARNIVQWNLNLFLGQEKIPETDQPTLRDSLTEGYNPIPNFFISARIPYKSQDDKFLSFTHGGIKSQGEPQLSRQFENRLFDRDTLLLCHYDVNFLFIVSLYGRNNRHKKMEWRSYVQEEFRKKVQKTLNDHYEFHILQPRKDMDCYGYIKENFHQLNGKIYRPSESCDYLILAMMHDDKDTKNLFNVIKDEDFQTNREIKKGLSEYFHSEPVTLEGDFTFTPVANVGTLEKKEVKKPQEDWTLENVLVGNLRKKDDFDDGFNKHDLKVYLSESIPSVNFLNIKYFLPMQDGKINGYYKVFRLTIDDGRLKLILNEYTEVATDNVPAKGISNNQLVSVKNLREAVKP